jgi:hypothetical protein
MPIVQMPVLLVQKAVWKYNVADWVKEKGLIPHHLRIISRYVENGRRRYRTFDTTLNRGYADYDSVSAAALEANSEIVMSAENVGHAAAILYGCESLRWLPYSIPQRQDCESLQRYLQAFREADRWSPTVWTAIGTALFGGGLLFAAFNQPKRKTTRRRRSQ